MPDSRESSAVRSGPTAEIAYPPGIAYMDGAFVPISEAKISVLDWGLLRSDATYDVVHVWKGRFFCLDKHLDRFFTSVAKLRMTLPVERDELARILAGCVARSGLENAYVEMICTRGVSPTFSRDPRDAINRFIAFAIPFGWIADEAQRERGLEVAIAQGVERISPRSVDPTVKNYHWLDLVAGLFEAYERKAENVMLTDGAGNVTEGPGFNIFALAEGRVLTPDTGVLEGITRGAAIELCAELGMPVDIAPLPVATLKAADEDFITSTAGGIMPVTKVDGAPIADGKPGPFTAKLTALYWAKHRDPAWSTAVEDLLA